MKSRLPRIINFSLVLLLSLLSAVASPVSPASAAYTNDWTTAGLHEMARYMGHYQASTDGLSVASGSGNLDILKPTGATTVEAAFLTTGGRDNQGILSPEPTVTLNGTAVATSSYSSRARIVGAPSPNFQGDFTNYFADVTSLVQTYLATNPAGTAQTAPWAGTKYQIPATYSIAAGLNDPAGMSLIVIFNNPTMGNDASVVVYFGTSNSAGQDFTLDFQTLPNAQTNSWLSFGISWSSGGGQYSNIKAKDNINTLDVLLSGSAGGDDDGVSAGDLLTVGGVGDATVNPTSPTLGGGQADDELYNIDSHLVTNANQVVMNMTNPSGDDNVFQAVLSVPFILSGTGASQTHTVTYDTQGGSAGSVSNYLNTVNAFAADPTKAGSTFDGWYAATNSVTRLTAPYSPPSFADITLYAKWVPGTQALAYDSQGGSAVASATYTGTVNAFAADPTKAGFTFDGWFASTVSATRLTAPYTPQTFADITVYAEWSAVVINAPVVNPPSVTEFTVSYDSNGGSDVAGNKYTVQINLAAAPTKTGYKFAGWMESKDSKTVLPSAYQPSPARNLTLYASWVQNATAKLTSAGFADASAKITPQMIAKIKKFVSANSGLRRITCFGYTEGPKVLTSDRALAERRALAVCKIAKSFAGAALEVQTVKSVNLTKASANNRRFMIVLSE